MHNLITDFIYKMPEKIKDMKSRNEESIRMTEEFAFASSASGAYAAGSLAASSTAAHQGLGYYPMMNASSYGYYGYYSGAGGVGVAGGIAVAAATAAGVHPVGLHRTLSNQVMAAANENHDFEDLLNLVSVSIDIFKVEIEELIENKCYF